MKNEKQILVVAMFLFAIALHADVSFNEEYVQYFGAMETAGLLEKASLIHHSNSAKLGRDLVGPWKKRNLEGISGKEEGFSLLYPENFLSWNSTYAYGINDGAIWQGRGINGRVTGGGVYRRDNFSVIFSPEFWYTQNSYFDILPGVCSSGYGDYHSTFDRLQRFGETPYADFSLGQTDIRFTLPNRFTIGLSTENYTLGSGQVNPILLSKNAAGFPHLDLGTDGVVRTNFGAWDGRAAFGILQESPLYNDNVNDDLGFIHTLAVGYSPSIIRGFTFGANFLFYMPLVEVDFFDALGFPGLIAEQGIDYFLGSNEIDNKDSVFSFNLEWVLPDSGFTVYLEWARTDFSRNFWDALMNVDHSQAYTFGFSQVIAVSGDSFFLLSGELSNTEASSDYLVAGSSPWYRHGWTGWLQGYTNKGQIFGAPIGPGSNSQYLKLSYYYPRGKIGGFIQRVRYDQDYYLNVLNGLPISDAQNLSQTEISLGLEGLLFLGDFELLLRPVLSYYLNRLYVASNDQLNFHGEIGLRYIF